MQVTWVMPQSLSCTCPAHDAVSLQAKCVFSAGMSSLLCCFAANGQPDVAETYHGEKAIHIGVPAQHSSFVKPRVTSQDNSRQLNNVHHVIVQKCQ